MLPQRAVYAAGGAVGAVAWLQLDKLFFSKDALAPAPAYMEPGATLHEGRTSKYGLPSRENLRFRQSYVASVNYERRIPNWVAEHLRPGTGKGPGNRKQSRFNPDDSVPEPFRSTNADYLGSGWSRGHMAPCGAHKDSQRDMDETFKLGSNIVPQDSSNNGSDWLRLERFARALPGRALPDVYVVSGPLFLPEGALEEAKAEWGGAGTAKTVEAALPKAANAAPQTKKKVNPPKKVRTVSYPVIGETGVAVPTHLFKVLLAVDAQGVPRRLGAFVMANAPAMDMPALESFVVPLEFVERHSGLQFFEKLGSAEERAAIPALCSPDGEPCQAESDTRILGWKIFGKLQACSSCAELKRAWGEVGALSKDLEEDFRGLGMFEREHGKAKKRLGCKDPTPKVM